MKKKYLFYNFFSNLFSLSKKINHKISFILQKAIRVEGVLLGVRRCWRNGACVGGVCHADRDVWFDADRGVWCSVS